MFKSVLPSLLLLVLMKPGSWVDPSRVSCINGYHPTSSSPLSITVQPVDQADCTGNKVTFSVVAEGGTGEIHYLWKRKRPTDAAYGAFGAADSTKLPVYNIGVGKEAPDGTMYLVIVSDQTDLLTSKSASLTVNEITGIAPAGVASYKVDEGTNMQFRVLTAGNVPLTYQWIKKFDNYDWRNLADNQIITGSQREQLSFTKISLADSGIYKVRVTFPTINGNQCSETSAITRTIHVKQVPDTIPPTFINMDVVYRTLCPENIELAAWDETTLDILPERNNFYRLYKNSNLLDLSVTNFHDNVTPPSELILHWAVGAGTMPFDPIMDEAGNILDDWSGQISLHSENIDFENTEECSRSYRIIFWLEDKAGNLTPELQRLSIVVNVALRPQIISNF